MGSSLLSLSQCLDLLGRALRKPSLSGCLRECHSHFPYPSNSEQVLLDCSLWHWLFRPWVHRLWLSLWLEVTPEERILTAEGLETEPLALWLQGPDRGGCPPAWLFPSKWRQTIAISAREYGTVHACGLDLRNCLSRRLAKDQTGNGRCHPLDWCVIESRGRIKDYSSSICEAKSALWNSHWLELGFQVVQIVSYRAYCAAQRMSWVSKRNPLWLPQ